MIGRYGGDREDFARERGRGQLISPDGPVQNGDQRMDRIAEDSGKIMRKLAQENRQPFEWDGIRRSAGSAVHTEGGRMADQINEADAVHEYKRMTKTFDALGIRCIFAPNAGVIVTIPRELTGKALATKLREISVGLTKQAQQIEDAAEAQKVQTAESDEADF